jgi:hypothetical protein
VTEIDRRARQALEQASRYFMGVADVQLAANRLAARLEQMGIPYAICGGLAVSAWGHRRTTSDVDVLLTADGLEAFEAEALGRDGDGAAVRILLAGRGAATSVRFPHPQGNSVRIDGKQYLDLPRLVELKLASGLAAPDRLQDFADVIALVRSNALPQDYEERLHVDVRAKYRELWALAQRPTGEF